MKKSILINKIADLEQDHIDVKEVISLFEKRYFLDKLKLIIETIFEVDDISSKCRKEKICIARSVFAHIAIKEKYKKTQIAEKINKDRTTVNHMVMKFKDYRKYYPQYKTKINETLNWYYDN